MKRVLIIAGIFFVFTWGVCFSRELSIVYVDLFEVFNKYRKTEEYDAKLEKEQSQKEKELQELNDELAKLTEEAKLLKDKDKEKKEKEISEKRQEFSQKKREIILDLRKKRDEEMREILEDIQKVIENYAKKNKIDIVLKKAGIAYGDESLDKTKEIISILNKKYNQ